MAAESSESKPVIIKKYANRRLYDTSTSAYITLEHLSGLVKKGVEFQVEDAKSGQDLTRNVLTQIIFEQENKGGNAFPVNFLRQIIRFNGETVAQALPSYLEMAINNFAKNEDRWKQVMDAQSGANPLDLFEEQARHNFAMFERGMNLFTSGVPSEDDTATRALQRIEDDDAPNTSGLPTLEDNDSPSGQSLEVLQKQMAEMQAQLERLSDRS